MLQIAPLGEKQWIHIDNPQAQEIYDLRDKFHFDSLLLEDLLELSAEQKVYTHGGNIFVLINFLFYDKEIERYVLNEATFVLGTHYFISVMRFPSQKINAFLHQLQKQTHHTHTPLDILMKVMHIMYDKTLRYLNEEGKKVFQLQELLVAKRKSEKKFLDDLLNQKINAITMLHDFNVHQEIVDDLVTKIEQNHKKDQNHDFHMHDLKSKLRKIVANIRLIYQTLDALINTYNAFMNMNTNMIAMTLTVFTAIIGVCNLFVGMYGMNVKLPREEYDYTFYYIISILLILGSVMSLFFYKMSVMKKYK